MSAANIASAAAGDMAQLVGLANQIKQLSHQIVSTAAAGKEKATGARGKLASAAEMVAGGTGKGQELQVRCGQSVVMLSELVKAVNTVAMQAEQIAQHGHAVESDIRVWTATLVR